MILSNSVTTRPSFSYATNFDTMKLHISYKSKVKRTRIRFDQIEFKINNMSHLQNDFGFDDMG